MTKTKNVKVRALRKCKISKNDIKNDLVFNYTFEVGEIKEISSVHANVLLNTGFVKEEK